MRKLMLAVALLSCLCVTACDPSQDTNQKDDITKEGDGTKDAPYTVEQALNLIDTFQSEEASKDKYYIQGKVMSVTEVSTSYGNATFTLVNGEHTIKCYRLYDLNNQRFTSQDDIKANDIVVIYASLQNYEGNDKQSVNGYLYSLNGKTSRDEEKPDDNPDTGDIDKEGDGTVSNPYNAKQALDLIDSFGNNDASIKQYYIQGEITKIDEISTSFGNGTFDIQSGGGTLKCFRLKDLDNKKFSSETALKVGDKVVVLANLQNYNGSTKEAVTGYVYSINGSTERDSSNDGNESNENENQGGNNNDPIGGGDYGTYYSSIEATMTGGMNGTLRQALTTLSKPKGSISYSSGLSSFLQDADEDPNNSSNMIFFYTQKSVKKQAAGTWNREHTWPQSLSGGLYGKTGGGCDALHIRPTYSSTNSTRGNLKFGNCPSGTVRTYEGVDYAKTSSGYFEPMDSVKGDCARIVFYMWTTYFAERNTPITNVASSIKTMVEWHKADPVSEQEILRNDVVYKSIQKNRNPYVDHPEWVEAIFG